MTLNDRERHRQGTASIKDGVPYANSESTLSLLPGAAVGEFLYAHRDLIGGTLLDAGAGNQPYGTWYAPLVKRAVSVDAAPISGLDALAMVDYLPFGDTQFDTVLATEVLEHVDDAERAVAEIYRVLRPGGHLLATVPYLYPTHEPPYDFRRFTHYGLQRLLERHGFTDVEVTSKGGVGTLVAHYAVLAATAALLGVARARRRDAEAPPPGQRIARSVIAAPQRALLRYRRVAQPVRGSATRLSLGYMVVGMRPGDSNGDANES
jgi:SAM-dependent methyltransferase